MFLLFIIFYILCPIKTQANERPLYEFGVAGFTGVLPDYPASDQTRLRTLILPTFVYRGFVFRSDERGTRARFFKTKNFDIDLSFGAALPARSEENVARKNMDDLDTLLEIGPRMNYLVLSKNSHILELELPLRGVFSTDFNFTKQRGIRLSPSISYRYEFNQNFQITSVIRLNYGTEGLHDYFYEVKRKDITEARPAYNAKGGFLGRSLNLFSIYNKNNLAYVIGARFSTFYDATNSSSSLFRTSRNSSVYIGFNYFYHQSNKKTKRVN